MERGATDTLRDITHRLNWRVGRNVSAGSAAAVTGTVPGTVVLATAAHCLHTGPRGTGSFKGFHADFRLLHRRIDTGGWRVRRAVVPRRWAEDGDVEFDTGFLVLDTGGPVVPHLDVAFGLPPGLDYLVGGYANTFGWRGTRGWRTATGSAVPDVRHGREVQGIRCRAGNGMSGGPWTVEHEGRRAVNGVSSLSYRSVPRTMFSPLWGESTRALHEAATTGHSDREHHATYQQ